MAGAIIHPLKYLFLKFQKVFFNCYIDSNFEFKYPTFQ